MYAYAPRRAPLGKLKYPWRDCWLSSLGVEQAVFSTKQTAVSSAVIHKESTVTMQSRDRPVDWWPNYTDYVILGVYTLKRHPLYTLWEVYGSILNECSTVLNIEFFSCCCFLNSLWLTLVSLTDWIGRNGRHSSFGHALLPFTFHSAYPTSP